MLKIPDFTKPEIDYIKANANFKPQEEQLFDLRNQRKASGVIVLAFLVIKFYSMPFSFKILFNVGLDTPIFSANCDFVI